MRQFPGTKKIEIMKLYYFFFKFSFQFFLLLAIQWKQEPVDLYDCRTRAWFIEAATSPKDVVILVDYSGSMTGIRKEIARHVVGNILDTLGNNDYVNILSFNQEIKEIEECFKDRLVQANLANVRTFKERMENITTEAIANFSAALNTAFNLLQKVGLKIFNSLKK